MFTQMSAQKGIKMFGEKAIAAIFKELKHLNDGVSPGKPVIVPIPFEYLSDKDKKGALEAVNLIAQKRCGQIKGRTCANGARKRKFIKDTDSFASPTVSLEAIMTTLIYSRRTWCILGRRISKRKEGHSETERSFCLYNV